MTTSAEAIYENGILRLLTPVALVEGVHVQVTLVTLDSDGETSVDVTAADAARQRFRNHAGAVSLGKATGIDNDEIDRDLAKAYAGLDR